MTSWPMVRLGEVVEKVTTWNPAKIAPETQFTYVDLSSVDQSKKSITSTQELPGEDAPSRARQILAAGDVMVSTVRPNLNAVARVADELDGATGSTGFSVLRATPGQADSRYLFHWVQSPAFVADMVSKATGASYPAVSDRIVKESSLPLPEVPEQRRIAAILDHVDGLRVKRREALTNLDELTQSIFIDMFGEEIREADNSSFIGERLSFLTSGSRGWAKYYSGEGDLFLRIQNVGDDELNLDDVAFVQPPETAEARRTRVETGDVLLSITADLGRTAVVSEAAAGGFINQHLAILRSTEFEPRYLSRFLSSPAGQRQFAAKSRGGTKAGLNFDDIRSLVVPCPDMGLQIEFARRASKLDEFGAQHRTALNQLDALFTSLQSRAFRGEL